ncbi:YheC/YheD family protein [Paenibacillus hodogayensis]|uniref:YheC/YheD family protein n=1 Tax=Paenibacillus hodogayensis TaxID=279208 RepID=A0ABV5VW69_9BACL
MKTKTARRTAQTVGIMVCPSAGEPPIPEKLYFRRLSLLGQKLGLTVFVFFPNRIDWERGRVVGYAYREPAKRWEKGFFPIPDTIYDRCFYSNPHTYVAYREPIRKLASLSGTRFLGYGLKGKWHVHEMLMRDETLRPHMPETELLHDSGDVRRWLEEKGELFLKPHGGSHGKGVLHIRQSAEGIQASGRTARNETVRFSFRSQRRMLEWVARFTAGRKYLLQRYLTLRTAEGDAFDIRALVQKNRRGLWELTGMAVRQGAPGSVTSNLHGGGHAEETAPFLRRAYGEEKASRIVDTARNVALRVPEVLEQYHGRLAELGVDLGVDQEGNVWVLEANSKPGRSAFAALSDKQVSLNAIRNPILYAKYLLDSRNGRPDP